MSEWLVAAAGIERQLADQLALEVNNADALIGDQELTARPLWALPRPIL